MLIYFFKKGYLMKINYKEIGIYTNKSEQGVKMMKTNNPEQLEIIKIGALCKKYEISIEDLQRIVESKQTDKS
jgi:DNA-binding Xre family transcriptional regulator